jgi:hypothetical protein
MADTATVVAASKYADDTRALRRDRFYVGMSAFLLFVVLVGFAPTFSLRALFQSAALPLYLHVHGAVLTAWYTLAFMQPCLVALGRTHWHRRLGVAAIPVALAVVAVSIVVLSNFAPRHLAEEGPAAIGPIFFGDLAVLILFTGLVSAALLARRRPETHKRLMMLASLSIVGPAVGRWAKFGFFAGVPPVAFSLACYALLMGVTIAHDVVTIRRVHPSLAYGWTAFWLLGLGAIAFSSTEFAHELLARLASR